MKKTKYAILLFPAAFLFHFYEYMMYEKGENADFLLAGTFLYIAAAGYAMKDEKPMKVFLISIPAILLSVALGFFFIEDTGWFKPIGRDAAIFATGIAFMLGVFLAKALVKMIIKK